MLVGTEVVAGVAAGLAFVRATISAATATTAAIAATTMAGQLRVRGMGKGAGASRRRWYPLTACLPLAPDHATPDTPRRMRYVTGDHAVQVFQLTSTVIDLTTSANTTVVYAATSMSGTTLHR